MIDAITVSGWLDRMSTQLLGQLGADSLEPVLMVGIHTGGVRIAQELHRRLDLAQPLGTLDISFYRDDFSHLGLNPQVKTSELPTSVEGRTVVLVDDVLYSGRTVRAALNEIFDYGRPSRVILVVLVEREGHELPIRADVTGERMALGAKQQVKLNAEDLGLSIQESSRT